MFSLILALLSGAALPFAFAPLGIYTLAFISPAILFYLWLHAKPWQAFWRGLFFGLGFFTIGSSWIFISINTYGNTPKSISVLITATFILVWAIFYGLLGLFVSTVFKNRSETSKCLAIFPASWVLWEWLRSIIFTGFPWLYLGYTQIDTPLHGIAPLFGVYGVSLAVCWIGGCLTLLARPQRLSIKSFCVLIIFILVGIGWIFSNNNWTKSAGQPMQVSLVQGNIPQTLKWEPNQLNYILQTYQTLTEKSGWTKLVVWPEAAVPVFPQQAAQFLKNIAETAKKNNSYLLFGIPVVNTQTQQYYNAMLLTGSGEGQYLKQHLVPFGEYLPLKPLFSWFINYFKVPMSDFTAGNKKQPPLFIDHLQIAPFICYEIAYPKLVLNSLKNKNLIVLISDDSWFGKSFALTQHLQMAQMRALETGRYLLLDSNTGVTAVINPFGKVIVQAPIDKPYVVTSQIVPMQGHTPLMLWKYYPVLIIIILLLIFS